MVHDLRGMFAFALWDGARRTLFLARDPYGIKPLYWSDDGHTLRLASQVKALLAGGAIARDPDPAGIVGFYLLGSVPEPHTRYRAIHELPAGSYLLAGEQGVAAPVSYFSVAATFAAASAAAASADAMAPDPMALTAGVRQALVDTVRHHLVADVPVGAFLSAGVDSGTLLALMTESMPGTMPAVSAGLTADPMPLQTITLAFAEYHGTPDDESPLAEEIARRYGTAHTTRVITEQSFQAQLPTVLDAMDQPSIDGINTWFVSQAAREQGLKVAISGLGGDELFGGYPLIEMALASGLALLAEDQRDPGLTTSLGTGELMRAALDLGAETLLVGIGGSATNDGGIGMASALGYRFLGADGRPVPVTGGGLLAIARIDGASADPRLGQVRVQAVCDVTNPLTGPQGAAALYAPQKGASPAQVAWLDAGLGHLADLVEGERREGSLGSRQQPGAGAAGGLGFGLMAFCGARLRPGAEMVLELLDFDRQLEGADLVLTAEGRLDGQTLSGKAPSLVAARARRLGIPCVAIAGGLAPGLDWLPEVGISAAVCLCPVPMPLAEAMARAEALLAEAAQQVLRICRAGRGAAIES